MKLKYCPGCQAAIRPHDDRCIACWLVKFLRGPIQS